MNLFSAALAIFLVCTAFSVPKLSAASAEFRIASITRIDDCTTLVWNSQPGELYTVYWTDRLGPGAFWRVAALNIPSGGTNTTWMEGDCDQMSLLAGSGSSTASQPALSEKELAERREAARARAKAAAEQLWRDLMQARENFLKQRAENPPGQSSLLNGPPEPGEGEGGGTNNAPSVCRFYRVARTGITGFVQSWGYGAESFGGLDQVIAVSAGLRDPFPHNLALHSNGTVTAWGDNTHGQCSVPTNVTDAVAVAAGGRHSVVLLRTGSVVIWGDNSLGQRTNAPANLTNVVDVKAGLWHTLALRADGTAVAWGDLFNRSNSVPAGLSNLAAIATGPRHCLALKSDGTVAAWGFALTLSNGLNLLETYLPTNVPASLSNVVAISAGMEHNQALLRNGSMVVWGATNSTVLNVPTNLGTVASVSAGWHFGLALNTNSTITCWGQGPEQTGLTNVVTVSAGAMHGLAISTNSGDMPVIIRQPFGMAAPVGGSVTSRVVAVSSLPLTYQWRLGGVAVTGQTNATFARTNVQESDVGQYQALVSTASGSVLSRTVPLTIIHPPMIVSQSPELNLRRPQGTYVVLSVTSQSEVRPDYVWYKDGQLTGPVIMLGNTASNLGVQFTSTNVEGQYWCIVTNVAGRATSSVWQVSITLGGEATGWGDNTFGQTSYPRTETNLIAIAAGGLHTLGLREDGTVVGWGDDRYGQRTPPSSLSNAIAIAASTFHSLALREDGAVAGWGTNMSGQLNCLSNLTNITAIAAGISDSLFLRADGTVTGCGSIPVPGGLSNVTAISVGENGALALLSNGTVAAWYHPLITPTPPPSSLTNAVAISAGAYHYLALRADGTVTGWGADYCGETQPPSGLSNVLNIAAGRLYSLALKNDGTIVSWGCGDPGQTNVPPGLTDTYSISAGYYHAAALAYHPELYYPVDVSKDLLLIYNTTSTNSVFVKDYYLAHRPKVGGALTLGLPMYAGELFPSSTDFTNELLNPVLEWYHQHPTIRPRYITAFLDVPTRVPTALFVHSSGVELTNSLVRLTGRSPYITHINMGGLIGETNLTNDCVAYIDKLAHFGSTYSPGKLIISASAGDYTNNAYFLDDENRYYGTNNPGFLPRNGGFVVGAYNGLIDCGVSTNLIDYIPSTTNAIRFGTNVAGYMSWGAYGWGSRYSLDLSLRFFGDASWYVMTTVESYNGVKNNSDLGDYAEWFSASAFGGANYSNTPVGIVGHVDEPFGFGITDGAKFLGFWAKGRIFSICAWRSAKTEGSLAVGDPLIRR